jgi:DNA-binding YbaB/EbfC family protein
MLPGLGNLANLAGVMKQAQEMSGRLKQVAEDLKQRRVTGVAGGGLVEVDASGAAEVLAVRIAPDLLAKQDRELLEDLLATAVNDAQQKARQLHADALKGLAGGLDLPGLGGILGNLGLATDP